MKHAIAICAALIAIGFAVEPAAGQVVYPGYVVHPGYALMPPHEAIAIVRSRGLEPLGRPVRHGPTYVLGALDDEGQQVRVVVDARLGRILRVMPISGPRYAAPPGRPPARIPLVVDNDDPDSRIAALPPGPDGRPAPPGSYRVPPPGSRGVDARPPAGQAGGPPPLPRPRPRVASAEASAAGALTAHPATRTAPQVAPSDLPGIAGPAPHAMEE